MSNEPGFELEPSSIARVLTQCDTQTRTSCSRDVLKELSRTGKRVHVQAWGIYIDVDCIYQALFQGSFNG